MSFVTVACGVMVLSGCLVSFVLSSFFSSFFILVFFLLRISHFMTHATIAQPTKGPSVALLGPCFSLCACVYGPMKFGMADSRMFHGGAL